jgi:hypothetical protein
MKGGARPDQLSDSRTSVALDGNTTGSVVCPDDASVTHHREPTSREYVNQYGFHGIVGPV